MSNRNEAGARYVERGDYSIVSPQGDIIGPKDFVATLRIGMNLEISIIQYHFGAVETGCPQCDAVSVDDSFAQWSTW
jgi:hypothetical protein